MHAFEESFRNSSWVCDGVRVFGKCKSGLSGHFEPGSHPRFKCIVCDDFDFCTECLNAKKIIKTKTTYHTHSLIEGPNVHDPCHGKYLFGDCN